MVIAVVNNHGVENLQDISQSLTAPVQRAVCSIRLLCSEVVMAVGGRDSSGPQGIFPPLKREKWRMGGPRWMAME